MYSYDVDGEEIPMVSSYLVLGLYYWRAPWSEGKAEDRADFWGEGLWGHVFKGVEQRLVIWQLGYICKLMGSLVESTLMYGAEVWGCSRHLEAIGQVQKTTCPQNVFWSGHTSSQSIFMVWDGDVTTCDMGGKDAVLAILDRKCWVLRLYEDRLLKKPIAKHAVKCGKGAWITNMAKCVGDFGWSGMGVDAVRSLSDTEIQEMLEPAVAWRNETSFYSWWIRTWGRIPKLCMLINIKEIADLKMESIAVLLVMKKRERWHMLMKLRGGTAASPDWGWEVARTWREMKEFAKSVKVGDGLARSLKTCLSLAITMPCLGPPQTAAAFISSRFPYVTGCKEPP